MQIKSKRLLSVGFAVVLLLILLLSGCSKPSSEAEKQTSDNKPVVQEWNFSMLSVLTGPVSFAGRPALWGAEYAAKEINAAGGIRGIPVKITGTDTAFDPAKAITAMSKAVDTSLIVFGPMDAPGGDAAGQVAADAKTPFVSSLLSDTRAKYQPYGVSYMIDTQEGDLLAAKAWLKANPDINNIVIFTVPTDPAIVKTTDFVKKELTAMGKTVAGVIEVQTGQLDMGPSVVKALNFKADGYIAYLRQDEYGKVANEMNKRGMTDGRRMIGTFAAMTPQLLELTKGTLNGSYIWNQIDPGNEGKEWQAFVEAYKKDNNGETPAVPPVAFYYDAVYAVKDAIETLEITGDPAKLAEERQKIAEYLYNSKELKGIQGKYKWEKGNKVGAIHLFQVKDNKYVKISLD